jgi:outer membrane protein
VALQARKTLEELVRKNVQNTEVDVKESVYKTYYNVLSGNKAMSFLVENIVSMEKMLHEVKVSYDNGLVEKLDVDRMQVQLTNLKTEETKLKNMLEVSTALLKYQIGMPSKQQIVLTDSLSTSQIKEGLVTINDFNYTQRIDYQLVETQKKVYEYDLKRYKLNALPTLSLFGIGGLSRASNEFNYFNSAMWYGYVGYGLNLSIPIFNGFQRRRQVDQAFLAVKKAEVTMENMRQTIDFQQEQSTTTFRNNILTLEAQEKNMGLAQDVYKTTQIKYREGVGSSVEMSTAENDLLKAQNNYFGALYDAVVAKIEYLKSYGKL